MIAPNPGGGENFDHVYPSGMTIGLASPGKHVNFSTGEDVLGA